ncbi:MAG: Fe-S-containing protein [Synergistaceae bacterium]|jgi:uncharacterized membrane protein|nr:Fe-S-containing protein [Synergistaceae bacterium]
MLEYLIKIIADTFCASIALSLLASLLWKEKSRKLGNDFYRGAVTGVAAAFIYAVLKRNTGFAVREYYDLGALAVSLLGTVGAIVSEAFAFGKSDGRARARFGRTSVFCAVSGLSALAFPNILLYPFAFAVGMDNIWNADFALRVTGYALGLLISFCTGAALFRISGPASRRTSLWAALLSFAVILPKLLLSVARILVGRNLIPRYKPLTRFVMWGVERENYFAYALMAVCALLAAEAIVKSLSGAASGENPAEVRRARYMSRLVRRFSLSVILGVVLSCLTLTAGVAYSNRGVELVPPIELPASDGKITIPLDMVDDGHLHRFVHNAPKGSSTVGVRYIVVKKNETAYGVGLDACDVCGPTGYYERKGQVVCILCDVVMNKSTIGLPGGCNPVPLPFKVEGGNMIIGTADLEAEARRF